VIDAGRSAVNARRSHCGRIPARQSTGRRVFQMSKKDKQSIGNTTCELHDDDAAEGGVASAKHALDDLAHSVTDATHSAAQSVTDATQSAAQSVTDATHSAAQSVTDAAHSAAQSVTDATHSAAQSVTDAAHNVGEVGEKGARAAASAKQLVADKAHSGAVALRRRRRQALAMMVAGISLGVATIARRMARRG
jgi:vacuolar-type H+-ATPase subunit H